MLSPYHAATNEQRTPPPLQSSSSNPQEPPTQTQLTEIMTQTQNLEELPSPAAVELPLAKLLPSCGAPPVYLMGNTSYAMGRSPKCDIPVTDSASSSSLEDNPRKRRDWAFGLISNRHCTIACNANSIQITDTSGNGTCINQSTLLRKGDTMSLKSGDEICLLNPRLVQRKIHREELHHVLQSHSYVVVVKQVRKACGSVRELAPGASSPSRLFPAAANNNCAGDYVLGPVLGTGTVGEVRRATHRRTGEAVAIKIMGRSQLDAEAKILQKLDHPYVIKLLDVIYEPNTVYLVMELMESDLFERVSQKGKYSEVEARFVMRRLLAALQYLHEHKQIVHRDLKPENILVRGRHEIKLTDFGLAKEDSHGRLRTFCGTPQYFAPEVLSRAHTVLGVGRYGKPADLYSLGVILHVMLTGFTPQLDLHHQIVWDPEDAKLLSAEAKSVVQNLLNPNPSARATVLEACEHAWMLVDDGDTHLHPLTDPQLPEFQRKQSSCSHTFNQAIAQSDQPAATTSCGKHPLQINQPCANSRSTISKESPSDAMAPEHLCNKKQVSPFKATALTSSCPPRRPLSPFNVKFTTNTDTPKQHDVSFDTSLLVHKKSITPGSSCKELTDDEVQSIFSHQTESIATFGTTDDEKTDPHKPRRISEMRQGGVSSTMKRTAVGSKPKGIKKKKYAASPIRNDQTSLKSFFSPNSIS